MEISLADYPDVPSISVDIPVFIEECQVVGLVNPEEIIVSPFNQVYELPFTVSFDMPLYEPSPLCGLSNTNVYY